MKALVLLMALVWATAAHAAYSTGITQIRYANAYCESGGNIHAQNVGPTWGYYGKWQFSISTWKAYAPRAWRFVRPDLAPEWVQDKAAMNVPYDAWPNC